MSSIKDVAKKAGVGVGTVSRVFNNSGYVSEDTRKKVEEAIKELNYSPNAMAKGLLKSNSNIIALILPTIHHPLFSKFAYAVEKELNKNGFKLILCNSDFEVEKELEYIRMLNEKIIDGIIFISNSDINEYIKEDVPIVTIDRHLRNEIAFIASDNYTGGRKAANHLIEKGCKKIAFLGGFPDVLTEVFKRREGFLDALKEEGIEPVVYETTDTIPDENIFVQSFIADHPEVDGVFAITDMLALKLQREYVERGIKIPGDVKIVGYDGIQLMDELDFGLTTIRQPIAEMGTLAATSIIKIVKGEKTKSKSLLPVTLVQGRTT